MSLLDILDQKILTPAASYIKILSQYKVNDDTIFCFVEGNEDVSFYSQFLERHKQNDLKFIICNGKENVINNYKNLTWDFYDKKRILFFIDKDYDDYIENELINDENVFVTQYYSIENYLVNDITLKKFIIDNFFITNEDIIKTLVNNFRIQHQEYINQLKKISAWMMYCRKNKHKVNFNEIKISDLFKINSDGILEKKVLVDYSGFFDYICSKTNTSHFNINEIKKYLSKINIEQNRQKFVRGKYDLHFMFLYLKYIGDNIVKEISDEVKTHNKNNSEKIVRPKVLIQLNEQNIFQTLQNKVKEPTELTSFLTQ